jgi:hypothetical protein
VPLLVLANNWSCFMTTHITHTTSARKFHVINYKKRVEEKSRLKINWLDFPSSRTGDEGFFKKRISPSTGEFLKQIFLSTKRNLKRKFLPPLRDFENKFLSQLRALKKKKKKKSGNGVECECAMISVSE